MRSRQSRINEPWSDESYEHFQNEDSYRATFSAIVLIKHTQHAFFCYSIDSKFQTLDKALRLPQMRAPLVQL